MIGKIKLAVFILIIGAFAAAILGPKFDNSITGQDISTRVEILSVLPNNCSFNMAAGWNYVSFHCIANSESRSDVLSSVNSSVEKIFTYTAQDTSDPWKSYNPSLPNWTVQQLNYMGRTQGYIILMSTDASYFYEGFDRSSVIPLRSGWNLVGYPDDVNQSINDSLSGLLYNAVITYNNGALLVYIPNAVNNTLFNFSPYSAYWINSSATQNWLVS